MYREQVLVRLKLLVVKQKRPELKMKKKKEKRECTAVTMINIALIISDCISQGNLQSTRQ